MGKMSDLFVLVQRCRGVMIAILLLLSGPATSTPSFDCSRASSDVESLICNDAALAALDLRLAERYRQSLAAIDALDAGRDSARNETRAMQRGWIKGRDDCWKAEDMRACVEAAYLTRDGELTALWVLQDPVTTAAYMCDGNPANEVVVFYFDTELPSIRLEYGDGIKTGFSVPAASGAKYAIAFGGTFWSKGDEAIFSWVEGEEMSCTAAPS